MNVRDIKRTMAVNKWIEENFEVNAVKIKACSLFPHGKTVTDKNGEQLLVYYDIMNEKICYTFPDKQ